MPDFEADVALLTEQRYTATVAPEGDWYLSNILRDDQLLQGALARRGLSSRRVDWADPTVDWTKFRCAVFRTTWDYFDRRDEFLVWMKRTQKLIRLCNSPDIVFWNMDKHYLADLAAAGVPVVPSRFLERGERASLRTMLEREGWREAVVKPCVSGAARHTYRVELSNADAIDAIIQPLLAHEAFLVQPFQNAVVSQGEDTLMLFGGQYTHAIRKTAKAGDFRVQDDFGGKVADYSPTNEQIELAHRAFSRHESLPVYGRVDMIQDNSGQWAVMELELIEPELWLRHHPASADRFAAGIADFVAEGSR